MVAVHVNPEHVHVLVDLPVDLCISEAMHLLKGASAHWINHNNLVSGRFLWGRGYGAFTVSPSHCQRVIAYIDRQEEHHARQTFHDEIHRLIRLNRAASHDGGTPPSQDENR